MISLVVCSIASYKFQSFHQSRSGIPPSPSTLRHSHDPLGWGVDSLDDRVHFELGVGKWPSELKGSETFYRLAVSCRPRLMLTYRPAAKNVYAVSFIPLRLEVLGRAILVWGRKYVCIAHWRTWNWPEGIMFTKTKVSLISFDISITFSWLQPLALPLPQEWFLHKACVGASLHTVGI